MVAVASTPRPVGDRAALSSPAPLLAVCGLGGGVGTTTLAYLIARYTAAGAERPVLLSDLGGPAAALATYAGASSPLTLAQASEAIARDRLDGRLFANAAPGLRLIARAPDLDDDINASGLDPLLADAREAHSLVVVDCGTLQRRGERRVAAAASTIAWVTRSTPSGVARAHAALGAFATSHAKAQLLVARCDRRRAAERELMLVADDHGPSLVLLGDLGDVVADPGGALVGGELALAAITGALR